MDQLTQGPALDIESTPDSPATKGGAGKSTLTSRLSSQVVFRVADPETARALGEALAGGTRVARAAAQAAGVRDDNGVAAGAEAAVDRASSSSGAPLPTHIQRQFEGSLGADLSSVRVHTSADSAVASEAVGARAYTVGQDIHFAEGQYRPDDAFGLHLLAHEVAHTVQQADGPARRQHKLEVSTPQDAAEVEADRAADAMVAGVPAAVARLEIGAAAYRRSGMVHRDGNSHANSHPSQVKQPADMTGTDWKSMVADETGPDAPSTIAISVPGRAPLPKGVTRDPRWDPPEHCAPGHHAPAPWSSPFDPKPHYGLDVFDRRDAAWEGYRGTVNATVNTYNAAAPQITNYSKAESDPALAALYELQQDGKHPGNLHQVANAQKVPRTNGSGITVGDLFTQISGPDGTKISVGREANTKGLTDNIAKAAKSEKVEGAITNLKAKDSALQGTLDLVSAAEKECSAAGHTLAATEFGVAKEKAESDKEEGESELAAAKGKAEAVKGYVTGALKAITFIATTLAAPAAAAAGGAIMIGGTEVGQYKPNTGAPGVVPQAQGVADIAGSSVTSTIAEKIVSYAYGADIAGAEAKITAATKAYRDARKGQAKEEWLAASDQFAANVKKLSAQLNFLKEKLSERKNAYLALASAAAEAGGGTQEEQDRMKALIMAIPVAKAVVAQTSNILNVLADPPDNFQVQIGFSMAVAAGHDSPLRLLKHAGEIKGYRTMFKDSNEFWAARVASLEGVIGSLSGK